MSFASGTWDGWDYIPRAWPHWLAAKDGVVLVATAGRLPDGSAPRDADGSEIATDRPVAVARVAMLAPGEGWLEGIRVDPAMRGLAVATDLQLAELRWAAASGASIVRYATGERNEASHRLGARHGFSLLVAFRLWQWQAAGPDAPTQEGHHDEEPSGFDDAAREQANAVRRSVLAQLTEQERIALVADGDAWWERLSRDGTFLAGQKLFEHRGWTVQQLTRTSFDAYLARGEVIVAGHPTGNERWALATLLAEAPPAEDADIKLGLLVGDGAAAADLAATVQRLAGQPISFWLPDSDASLLASGRSALGRAGFVPREWALHILARRLNAANPPPAADDQTALELADEPAPVRAPDAGVYG
jgi:GNAT superfamily N-acetyltransferase